MKKIFLLIMIIFCVVPVALMGVACNGDPIDPVGEDPFGEDPAEEDLAIGDPVGEDPTEEEPAEEDPVGEDVIKILLEPGDKLSEFSFSIYAGALKAAEEAGNVEIIKDASGTAAVDENISILEQAIVAGYDGIICMPYIPDDFEKPIKEAIDAGIPVATLHTRPLDDSAAIGYAGPDQIGYANAAALWIGEEMGGEGKVQIQFAGISDQEKLISEEFQKTINEKYPDIVVFDDVLTLDPAKGAEAVSNIIQNEPDINAFVGFSSASYAAITTKACEEQGILDDVIILGIDPLKSNLDELEAGRIQGIIDQGQFASGYICVKMILNYLKDGDTGYDKFYVHPNKIVTVDDIPEYQDMVDSTAKLMGN